MTTQINGNTGVSQVQPGSINADDFNAALFLANKSANGYSYLPNGLLVQWGKRTAGPVATGNVSFPVSFPNAKVAVVATDFALTSASTVAVGVADDANLSQFTFYTNATEGGNFGWIAIGY